MSKLSPESGCILPFIALSLEPGGRAKPCCKFGQWSNEPNANSASLAEMMNSVNMNSLRQEFLKGGKPAGCARCFNDEAAGLESMRQSRNHFYHDLISEENMQNPKAQIVDFGFGNTCNAACVTCSSDSSSLWIRDEKKLCAMEDAKFNRTPREVTHEVYPWSDADLQGLKTVSLMQTETLINPELGKFLKRVTALGGQDKRKVELSTNGQHFPDPEVVADLFSFGKFDLQFSIDGIGERNDYLRYPLKFALIERNIHRWLALAQGRTGQLVICRCTVSIYNILYLREINDWWESIRATDDRNVIEPLQFGFALYPTYLSPTILPPQIKKMAYEKFPHKFLSGLINRTLEPSQVGIAPLVEPLKSFFEFTRNLDSIRRLDARKTFPELFSALDELQSAHSPSLAQSR